MSYKLMWLPHQQLKHQIKVSVSLFFKLAYNPRNARDTLF